MSSAVGPVALVGVGLMGGSLGLALRGRLGAAEVRGVDADGAALAAARERGAITHAAASLEAACAGAAAVVVATPVGGIAGVVRRALAAAPPDCLVTDLGSVKAPVIAALSAAERARFIGGHPVCGGEQTGVAHARGDLFDGATWFLTPAREARSDLFGRLHGLVAALGARPVAIDAEVHDRLMALVSHLPHVLAAALVNQAAATAPGGREALRSAGPSFGDLTRVAGSNPPLWADILLANREAVGDALARFGGELARVGTALAEGDRPWLEAYVGAAGEARARLAAGGGAPSAAEPWRLVVRVPNRPGAISEIATALGHAHINIEDLRFRPGVAPGEGELALVLDGAPAAGEAARLVGARGYPARCERAG